MSIRDIFGEFTKIILVANIIALPVGYFLTKNWLDDFVYRIDLEWWFFGIAGISNILVAWLIVGWQSFKVARLNPTQFLRNE